MALVSNVLACVEVVVYQEDPTRPISERKARVLFLRDLIAPLESDVDDFVVV